MAANKTTSCQLRNKWVYIIGDSSTRMLFQALVGAVNGSLSDPHFGHYAWENAKGGCEQSEFVWSTGYSDAVSGEGDKGTSCFREFIDLQAGIRLSFSFKTHPSEHIKAVADLVSSSQVPDVFLLGTGAWDLSSYNKRVEPASDHFASWVHQLHKQHPQSTIVEAGRGV